MSSTIVNCCTVIVGSLLGVLLGRRLGDSTKQVIFSALGIFTLVVGVKMAMEFSRVLYIVPSLILGGVLGCWLKIEEKILSVGRRIETRFASSGSSGSRDRLTRGFLDATILFTAGALAIVGSFEAGITGSSNLILTKAALDGFASMALASTLGIGVIFSALSILVYQGGITLIAGAIGEFVPPLVISEVSAMGGIVVVMIGINLMKLTEIKTVNFLPALLLVVLFSLADPWLTALWSGFAG